MHEETDYYREARARGARVLTGVSLPEGLERLNVYVGLIHGAIELGKIIGTEDRDLQAISTHHDIEMSRIRAGLAEIEAALMTDVERDQSLRDKTFESINLLIAAGQYEIAVEFQKRLGDQLSRPALETIVDHRNVVARKSGTTWTIS